ncbi:hypothetical protein DFH11DRAFT_1568690 [Phellopilus nigrolimitatus]|nr:hypothetical protein DFH11DRAFT_1568690 [Phellopilus nigrolimitatus]
MLHIPAFQPNQSPLGVDGDDDVKVPVTFGVMSRCPDALLCESVFDKALPRVEDKIDLSLSFIGTINASEPDFGVTCLHGPEECAGNVQELCATKYLDQKQWWAYLKCQNFNGRGKVGNPDIALKCADTAKFDWLESGVGKCAGEDGSGKGEEGVGLLQESVRNSKELGIEKSCTILINNRQACIHDGTWKECEDGHAPEDFVRQINNEYERLNAA